MHSSARLRYEFSWSDDDLSMNFSIVCLLLSSVGCNITGQVPDTTPFPSTLTSFACHGRLPGYYADLETACKTYHVCDGHSHFTYICPRRTLFQQRSRICDHSYLVRCEDSPRFYPRDEKEEEDLLWLAESEENLPSKEELVNDDERRKEFISTETGESTTEITDEPTTSPVPIKTPSQETPGRPEVDRSKESFSSQSVKKFLKIRLNDVRSLFFIPEFGGNTIVAQPEREFVLPVEKSDFMKFKNRKDVFEAFTLCPPYCNPKYFLQGTCHPCIMIK